MTNYAEPAITTDLGSRHTVRRWGLGTLGRELIRDRVNDQVDILTRVHVDHETYDRVCMQVDYQVDTLTEFRVADLMEEFE